MALYIVYITVFVYIFFLALFVAAELCTHFHSTKKHFNWLLHDLSLFKHEAYAILGCQDLTVQHRNDAEELLLNSSRWLCPVQETS